MDLNAQLKNTDGTKKAISDAGTGYGGGWPPVGHYQFYVKGIKCNPDFKSNMIIIELKVIAGTMPGQEEVEPTLWLWHDKVHPAWGADHQERITRFFWAVGLIEEGEQKNIEPNDAIGKCFIGEVTKQMRKKDKDSSEKIEVIQMGDGLYWRLGNKAIEGIVKTIDIQKTQAPKEEPGHQPESNTKTETDAQEEDDGLEGL